MNAILSNIQEFEVRLGLPKGFYFSLLEESDWAFVIKLHALFEGASTRILNLRLGGGKIELALSHLDFGHGKYGKVVLLAKLGVLDARQAAFLKKLSELRNELVHRIENVTFSFAEYVQTFDDNKRKSFCDRVGYAVNDPVKVAGASVSKSQFICENPKLSLWLTASDIFACILVEEQFVNLDQARRELELRQVAFAREITDMMPLVPHASEAACDGN